MRKTILSIALIALIALIGVFGSLSAYAWNSLSDGNLTIDSRGNAVQALRYTGTTQKVTVTNTSAMTSNALTVGVSFIRVICTTDSFMAEAAASPTATTTDLLLSAGVYEYQRVWPLTKVAFIRLNADGTCYVSEMN